MLKVSDFTLYIPFGLGFALMWVVVGAYRHPHAPMLSWRSAEVIAMLAVALVLVGPYGQRFVSHVVDREGGGSAGLAALAVFITGAIAYVVFIGQQYEAARVKAEDGVRELQARSRDIEAREREAADREAILSEGLQLLEDAMQGLDYRVQHETLRAVALSAIDGVLLDERDEARPDRPERILLMLLRDLVGRTTLASVEFDAIEVEAGLDQFSRAGKGIDSTVKRSVCRYLDSLVEAADTNDQLGVVAEIRGSLAGLPSSA
jgi:hypothetical protein